MDEEMKGRGVADVFKWFLFYSTDVIGELSFGESFRMLEIGKVSQPLGKGRAGKRVKGSDFD